MNAEVAGEPVAEAGEDLATEVETLRAEVTRLNGVMDRRRRFIESMQAMMEAADGPTSEGETLSLLETVLDRAVDALEAKHGALLAWDEDEHELVYTLVAGATEGRDVLWSHVPFGAGIGQWVALHRQAVIINDVLVDARFHAEYDTLLDPDVRTLCAAPMVGAGHLLGVVMLGNRAGERLFTTSDQARLALMCRFGGEMLYSMMRQAGISDTRAGG